MTEDVACSDEEILKGIVIYEGGGVYEVLPDGSIGGALCAAGG